MQSGGFVQKFKTNILIPLSAYHFICSDDEDSGFFYIVGNSPDYIAFITEDSYLHNHSPNNPESVTLNFWKNISYSSKQTKHKTVIR